LSAACPWCRERIPALHKEPTCGTCGREIQDKSGNRLRPLDLDFEKIVTDADERSLTWIKRGAIFAFVCGALGSLGVFAGPVAVVAFVLLFAGQFVWARFFVGRPYTRHFGAVRKFVTRWTSRLALVFVIVPLHGTVLAIPLLGLVLSPAVFAGTCWILRAYFRFHLEREHRRQGVTVLEKLLLVVLAFVSLLLLVLFALVLWGVISFLPEAGAGK